MAIGKTNWTKMESPEFRYLSLRGHALDSAGAAFSLLRCGSLRTLEIAAGRRLDALDIARICMLVGLHDIGKAMRGYYLRVTGHKQAAALPPESTCHIRPLLRLLSDLRSSRLRGAPQRFYVAAGLDRVMTWFPSRKGAATALEVLFSHHKGCRGETVQHDLSWGRQFQPFDAYDPAHHAEVVFQALIDVLPQAVAATQTKLPDTEIFLHALLGLVEHADWLASTQSLKSLDGFDLDGDAFTSQSRFDDAVRKSSTMLSESGFYDALNSRRMTSLGEILGKESDGREKSPRPVQLMVASMPLTAVLGIEAPTGEGKTEAAIIRFFMMHAAGLCDGLYFATPNRSAAFSLHKRIVEIVERVYPNAPVPVLAVPGMNSPSQSAGKSGSWSSEGGRYLSSGIAVGTIDQLLLGGLRVPYSHVRGFASPRLHLVIDEVHSCDPYMMRILRNSLEWHLALGGSCTLLSATFGSDGLRQLGSDTCSLSEAISRPYPCVWNGCDFASMKTTPMSAEISRARRVILKKRQLSNAVGETVAAVSAGARVVAIFSTVRSARNFQKQVETMGCPTFAIPGACRALYVMHHGRYAAEDRRMLDKAVDLAIGKLAQRSAGFVLVGTQTLEQSLDIDADLLITDICPMEVLIQRLGRLFRHIRERPVGYETPMALVVTPDDIDACIDQNGKVVADLLPQGNVYRNVAHIALSMEFVEKGEFKIPTDNRELVERCTHPEAVAAYVFNKDPKWKRHLDLIENETGGALSVAATARMNWSLPPTATENRIVVANEGRIRTRIGADSVDLATDFISFAGNRITTLSIRRDEMRSFTKSANVLSSDQEQAVLDIAGQRYLYDRLGLQKMP